MILKTGRMALLCASALLLMLMAYAGGVCAQGQDGYWERQRDEDEDARRAAAAVVGVAVTAGVIAEAAKQDEWERRERGRRERDDAKKVAAGAVGIAVVAGVIAASAKRERENRERADYCASRYGNYDRRNDTYRGSDGYTYNCR